MNKIIPLLLFVLMMGLQMTAQTRFPVVQVYQGSGSFFNEPSVCVNPKNVNQVVAGSVINDCYYSANNGAGWAHTTLSCSWGVWGDPAIVADTNSNFYYFHLSYPNSPGWWIDRIICQKSTDGGQTWSDGSYTGWSTYPKAQDKPWAAVNRANNHIYVTWTQFDNYGSSNPADSSIILFSKSTDAGITWSTPFRLSRTAGDCHDDDNTDEGAVPCVGPAGQIYVSWSGPPGIMFNRSLDDGATWVYANIFVAANPGGWNYSIPGIDRSNGMPVTCCDLSYSPYRGTIYVNWSDQRNGTTDTDVWIVKSTDGGNTWTSALRVNDDPPGKQQFFTWMTVDHVTGYVYIVFYDRRNYSDNQTDVYLAVSKDGGATFENMRISSAPFTPTSSIFFGDYTNISSYNNVVRPIWGTLTTGGTKTIYSAIIDTLYAPTVKWTGGISADWNNPWNWSPRAIPSAAQNVLIPQTASGRYPNVNATGLSCHDLTVQANATMTIPNSGAFLILGNFTINNLGSITNNGTITIKGKMVNENTP